MRALLLDKCAPIAVRAASMALFLTTCAIPLTSEAQEPPMSATVLVRVGGMVRIEVIRVPGLAPEVIELRDVEISTGSNSFLNSYNDTSAFGIYFSTNLNQYARVIEIIFKEFKRLKDFPVSEKELKKVKEYLKGGMVLSLESTTNRMMRSANSILYYDRVVSVEEYLAKIDGITAGDVQKTANELLNESKLIKVILKSDSK